MTAGVPRMERVGDNLYRKGGTYYAAAVPPGRRRLKFKSLGQVTKARARELLPAAIAELRGQGRPAPDWAVEIARRSRREEVAQAVLACRVALERAVYLHADERARAATAIAALEDLEVSLRDARRAVVEDESELVT